MSNQNQINVSLFFNNEKGIKCYEFLKKKKIKINSIFLAKKKLNKKIINYLKKKKIKFKLVNNLNLNKEIINDIKKNNTELNVLCGFPYILRNKIFSLPRLGTLNLHAGKLPYFRGASPMVWQIIKGRKKIWLSIIKIGKGIDTGKIVIEKSFELKKNENVKDAHKKANNLYPELLWKSINIIRSKKKIKTQSFRNINYYKQRTEEDNQIRWNEMNSTQIFNFVRAITKPYTGAYTYINKFSKVRIFKCKIVRLKSQLFNPGDFFKKNNNIIVKAKSGFISFKINSLFPKSGKFKIL